MEREEDLLDLLVTARTHPDREHVHRLLHRIYARCAASDLPELHRLATTIEAWWPQIPRVPAYRHHQLRLREDTNRVIKTIARDAYASRNRRTSAYAAAPPPPDATADTSNH